MVAASTVNVGRRRQFQAVFEKVTVVTAAIDPVTLDANEQVDVDVTGVSGVALGDIVLVAPGIDLTEINYQAHVSATDVITISLGNTDANDVNIASSVWTFVVLRPSANLKVSG